MHHAEEVEKESHLLEELEKLSLSGTRLSRDRHQISSSFSPLLDIPVDGYDTVSREVKPFTSPIVPNWLLARSSDSDTPLRTDICTVRSVHFDEVSLHSAADRADVDRGFKNGHTKGKKDRNGERSKEPVFTLQSAARRSRPLLSQVFGPQQHVEGKHVNGHQVSSGNGLNGLDTEQEYELKTVSISKTKQSLGECL